MLDSPGRLSERRRKEIGSLQRKKMRDELGQTLVEGWRAVGAAVDAGVQVLDLVVASSSAGDPRLAELARRANATPQHVADSVFERMSDVSTAQGILAVVPTAWIPIEHLAGCRRILVLDGVQDPGNVGTLIRTAGWFGVEAVLVGPGSADPYQPKVVRATMGGLWDVGLAECVDLAGALSLLVQQGFELAGADLEGEDASQWRPEAPCALVLGSEAHGLSEPVHRVLTRRVTIAGAPGRRGTESLNVAVAGGILMHAWLRPPAR